MPYKNSILIINDNNDKIKHVDKLLSDEISRHVYKGVINIRKYNYVDYSHIAEICDNQYFVDGLFTYGENEVFVDAGAHNGENSIQFVNIVKGKYDMIYVFEPDKHNYLSTKKKIEAIDKLGRTKIINKGLFSRNGNIGFNARGTGGSNINENSENKIEVTKLDDEIDGKVTFIKMDIEGAETDALLGAEKTIKTHKPKLAICIYHKMDDLWKIPLLVNSFVPEYKLYIRHHKYSFIDTVLYATI